MSVLEAGATAVLPLPGRQPYEDSSLPTNALVFWACTDMTDSRWTWGRSRVLLRQEAGCRTPQKPGLMAPDGWIACTRKDHLFVQRAAYLSGSAYPDYGCSLETSASGDVLELESLGPLARLEPGGRVEHVEDWSLFDGDPAPRSEEQVIASLLPQIALTLGGGA